MPTKDAPTPEDNSLRRRHDVIDRRVWFSKYDPVHICMVYDAISNIGDETDFGLLLDKALEYMSKRDVMANRETIFDIVWDKKGHVVFNAS